MSNFLADEELAPLTTRCPPRPSRRSRGRATPHTRQARGSLRALSPAGSHLLLGFAAGLVDRVLVLLGGLARVLLLLVVFGRLREGEKDVGVSGEALGGSPGHLAGVPAPLREPPASLGEPSPARRPTPGPASLTMMRPQPLRKMSARKEERGVGRGRAPRRSDVTAGAEAVALRGRAGGASAGALRYGHLQRLRGQQGWRPHLPAGPLHASRRHREDVQLSARSRPAPARRARRRRLRAAGRHPRCGAWEEPGRPGEAGLTD